MMLVKYDPVRGLRSMDRELDRLMGSVFGEGSHPWVPAMDIKETEDRFEVTLDLPGLESDDLELSVDDGLLKVKGERSTSSEETDERFHKVERRYGSFARTVRLSRAVDVERIEASFDKGVLTITVPKREEARPRTIEVVAK
jgi:HSP20 family protein